MVYWKLDNSHIMVASLSELQDNFCFTAKKLPITQPLITPRGNLGQKACRQLLRLLQQRLNLADSTVMIALIETQFPYYFVLNEKKYGVSFSHSREQVAVMVMSDDSKHLSSRFGIDVEDKLISDKVARRFFSEVEWQWLNGLAIEQKQRAKTLLWTLKESLIKAQVADKLIEGLKINLLNYLTTTQLTILLRDTGETFNQISVATAVFGFSPLLNCGFVVIKKEMDNERMTCQAYNAIKYKRPD